MTLKPIPEVVAITTALTIQHKLIICPFPIFTRSGEVSVSLELSPNKVTLSSEQCEKVVAFLNYTFSSVLRLQKHLMIFGPESAENSYYIVPITNKPAATVDWNFVDLIWEQKDAVPNPVPEKERRNFKFDPTKYQDAVVMPWYRNQDQPQYFYVAEICSHLSPKSQFPGGEYNTFEEYYYAKYGLKVQCLSQPLLDVDHTSARLNFLTPRYVNRKGVALPVSSEHTKRNKRENLEQKQILVAELCALHPFPASLWRQAVSLPCILYRINGLLLADELRCKVAHDIGLGIQHLSPEFRWPPLDFGWSLAEVLQKSREALMNSQLAVTDTTETKKKNKIIELCEEEDKPEETEVKEESNGEAKPWLDIGTWSNDMAIQGDECDSFTDEMPEDLPCNITMLTGNSLGDGPSGSDWGTGIQSHTRVRYGSPTFIPPRRPGSFMDAGMSDTYSSFSDDDDDDDCSSDMSDDLELVSDNLLQPVHPDGLRIEFKGDTAEAFDDQPTFILPDDVLVEPKEKFLWDWKEFGTDWEIIKASYEKQVATNSGKIKNGKCLLHSSVPFNAGRFPPEQGSEISIHRHPVKCNKSLTDSNISTSKNTLSTMNCAVNANALDSSSHNTVEGNESIQLLNKSRDNKFSSDIGTELIIRPDVELKDNADSEHGTPFGKCLPDQKSSDVIQGNQNVNSAGVIAPLATSDSGEFGLECYKICHLITLLPLGITFSFDKQPDLQSHPGPSPSIILQALTMSNANDGINLERLETIGDSFLKYAITTYLYCTHENIHEGKLSHLRSKQATTKFEPHDNWLPPCYFVPWKLEKALIKAGVPPGMWNRQELASLRLMDNDTIDKLVWERRNEILSVNAEVHDNSEHLLPFVPYNLLTQHSIPDKSLADCVEALIGAYLIACGPRGALLFMSWLGIKVLPAHTERSNTRQYGWLAPPPSPLLRNVPDPDGELNRMLNGFDQFEERLKYRFRDRAYLLQAMSHASFSPNRLTDCYQRLEFLGDAVLDYLITRYLYEDVRQHSPGALTDLRSALVNNAIFAVLAVRHGFHQFFLHLSPGLAQVIQRFVPKALGDVFESVAGAIFLDSGMSLDAVWRTYHAMMAPELELFSAHVPKSPIRELLEREPETAKFGKPEKLADGRRVRVSVEVFGQGVFRGVGRNYRIAKSTAAKCALRHLSTRRNVSMDVHRFY
ncbi:hypothetical protein B566_EDAN011417 [Ephemera danica]|nr:hypothetical protein B566_EDAN011417 [Ephemera danica]